MVFQNIPILFLFACTLGFFMAWGIGANDVANAMGTAVGSRTLTVVQALWIAGIFETLGATLVGGEVTQTIRGHIVNPQLLAMAPQLFIAGMLAALAAAGSWLLVASHFGWPVSTTHSVVGAVIGFGIVAAGFDVVDWGVVGAVITTWIVSPVIAGIFAYFIFRSIQQWILNHDHPFLQAKRYLPIYLFFLLMIFGFTTFYKGFIHCHWHFSHGVIWLWVTSLSLLLMSLSKGLLVRIKIDVGTATCTQYQAVERIFGVFMVFLACAMAFAHGSNDVANAMGPLFAVVSMMSAHSHLTVTTQGTPLWILLLGSAGIVLGLATYGYRVMATVGKNITELTPSRGFAASFATASTVVVASGIGIPISTTQTLVGAIMGVGLARGIAAINLQVVRDIFVAWIVTLPAGAVLAMGYFYLFRLLLS